MKCYCGALKAYEACCGLYIDQGQYALSPEALMRSRYSAYVQAKMDYIMATMCGPAAEGFDPVEAKAWAQRCDWLGLTVVKARYHLSKNDQAMVEFKAYYRENGQDHCLHEKSVFLRQHQRWFYYRHL